MAKKTIYTIGHSNHEAEYFLELLQAHGVDWVVDVRSIPASQYNPQYNKPNLANFLKNNDVLYLHCGKEFGARHTDPELQDKTGKVDFEKVQATDIFRQGVEKLEAGIEAGHYPALMCAEADPLHCHRFSMIAQYLAENGFEVRHILKDKSIVAHPELEKKILNKFAKKLPQPTIFEPNVTPEDQLKAAYKLHNQQVGWKDNG